MTGRSLLTGGQVRIDCDKSYDESSICYLVEKKDDGRILFLLELIIDADQLSGFGHFAGGDRYALQGLRLF